MLERGCRALAVGQATLPCRAHRIAAKRRMLRGPVVEQGSPLVRASRASMSVARGFESFPL
jgi:hypothetical protein